MHSRFSRDDEITVSVQVVALSQHVGIPDIAVFVSNKTAVSLRRRTRTADCADIAGGILNLHPLLRWPTCDLDERLSIGRRDRFMLSLWLLFSSSAGREGGTDHADLCSYSIDDMQPSLSCEIFGNDSAVLELTSWLDIHSRKRKEEKPAKKRRRRIKSDEEIEFEELPVIKVLQGVSGAGKTSAVYAAARQLGIHVIEIDAGQARSGAAVRRMVSEATQSRGVQLGGDTARMTELTLLLFDEVSLR
jgi:hypothetical protein